MTDDILLDRVFKRFDADNDGYVNREEWILGLSVFLKGTDTERVQGGREGGSVVGLYLGWDMDLPVYTVSASLSLIWRVKSTSLHNSNHNQGYHNGPSTSPNTHLSECSTASTSTISTAMDSSPARRC